MLQRSRGALLLGLMMLIFVRQNFVIWLQHIYQNAFWQVCFFWLDCSLKCVIMCRLNSSFTFGFKDGRKVFCFRNVTTGCIGAFERFNCLMKLSVGKARYCKFTNFCWWIFVVSIIVINFLITWFNNLFNCSQNNRFIKIGGFWFHFKISLALIKLLWNFFHELHAL